MAVLYVFAKQLSTLLIYTAMGNSSDFSVNLQKQVRQMHYGLKLFILNIAPFFSTTTIPVNQEDPTHYKSLEPRAKDHRDYFSQGGLSCTSLERLGTDYFDVLMLH